MRHSHGFTLIELMIVVVIIGILAAIAIPNFILMQHRAKEGSTKANMHTLQLAAEDYAVQNDGTYTADAEASGAAGLGAALPTNFRNPFDFTTGPANAYEDRATFAAPATNKSGIVSYADSSTFQCNIKGWGKSAAIAIVLTSG
jgi:prepilin-type N-terminal cleavage/methylation domain-containing protein